MSALGTDALNRDRKCEGQQAALPPPYTHTTGPAAGQALFSLVVVLVPKHARWVGPQLKMSPRRRDD